MANKPYREMTNEELTGEACRISYARKQAGEKHANLIYALACRIREIEDQDDTADVPTRCDTVEKIAETRGLSREAQAYLAGRQPIDPARERLAAEALREGGLA